jgi:hypothetical protein
MRRFEIRSSAKALVWAAVLLSAWGGSNTALAQSFDFTFSGGTVMAIGAINVTGTRGAYTIIGISGNVSGFANPAADGAITSLLAPNSFGTNFTAANNDNVFLYPNARDFDRDGVAFTVSGGADEDINVYGGDYFISTSSAGQYQVGTTFTAAPNPAPIPGSGLLSYLVLGFGGLLFVAKKTLLSDGR